MSKQNNRFKQGQVIIFSAVLFMALSLTLIVGISSIASLTASLVRRTGDSGQAYFLAESGIEDIMYRLIQSKNVDAEESLSLGGGTVTTITSGAGGDRELNSTGNFHNLTKRIQVLLALGSGASFNFGVQTDTGGFVMANSSTINGNLYSNGPIIGSGSSIVRGDVVSAGPTGLVDGIHATGTVYSHTIRNSDIDEDAYYQSLSATTIEGTQYPDSPDQATTSLPISDEQIEEWESDAAAGGVIDCPSSPYKITSATTLGPAKIDCDVEISGTNFEVVLLGPIWINGDLAIKNSPTIRVHESVGARSVAVITDKPTDRAGSSRISLDNSSVFQGSGKEGSYVLMISQNNSAETGGSAVAINVGNSAEGDILVYARHGEISLGNSVELKQVTAYRIRLANFSVVNYALGISSLLFTSGPGGTWKIHNWIEM